MARVDFAYAPANDVAGVAISVSVFADREHIRGEMAEDVEAGGLSLREASSFAALLERRDDMLLGEVASLDCPAPNGAMLAALARLDMRAARAGTQLIVSTTVDALDAVFASLDQSHPQILVNPTRAERVVALGRALARIPKMQVRELSAEDRLLILRLTEQVGELASKLDGGTSDAFGGVYNDATSSAFSLESPTFGFRGADGAADRDGSSTSLPDPKLVRRIIRQRQKRARFFDPDLFADPAWDILLDLTAARAEEIRVSVSSLCIASGVPATTALRWISQMVESGLLVRVEDTQDRRRAFIELSDRAVDGMARYFAALGDEASALS